MDEFTEYRNQRQAERIADAVIERHQPIAECLVTIEEIERETELAIKQALEYQEACRRG